VRWAGASATPGQVIGASSPTSPNLSAHRAERGVAAGWPGRLSHAAAALIVRPCRGGRRRYAPSCRGSLQYRGSHARFPEQGRSRGSRRPAYGNGFQQSIRRRTRYPCPPSLRRRQQPAKRRQWITRASSGRSSEISVKTPLAVADHECRSQASPSSSEATDHRPLFCSHRSCQVGNLLDLCTNLMPVPRLAGAGAKPHVAVRQMNPTCPATEATAEGGVPTWALSALH
jgi:hypothetical protein